MSAQQHTKNRTVFKKQGKKIVNKITLQTDHQAMDTVTLEKWTRQTHQNQIQKSYKKTGQTNILTGTWYSKMKASLQWWMGLTQS